MGHVQRTQGSAAFQCHRKPCSFYQCKETKIQYTKRKAKETFSKQKHLMSFRHTIIRKRNKGNNFYSTQVLQMMHFTQTEILATTTDFCVLSLPSRAASGSIATDKPWPACFILNNGQMMGGREGCIRPKTHHEKLQGWTGLFLFGSVLSLAGSSTNPFLEGRSFNCCQLDIDWEWKYFFT